MDALIRDIRFALRSLRKAPLFTTVTVLTLSLGIGATAAIFGLVDAVAFRPLPVEDPDELVAVYTARREGTLLNLSYPDYLDFRAGARAFEDLAAFAPGPFNLTAGEESEAVWGAAVSPNYFELLGLEAARGRLFREDAAREGAVVVLGHGLWSRRFGGDPAVVGQAVELNGHPFTVVGIAPPRFIGTELFTYQPRLWIPTTALAMARPGEAWILESRGAGRFKMLGRLADGATLESARASAAGVADAVARADPEAREGLEVRLFSNETPINPWLAGPDRIRFAGTLLLLGAGLVLLVACANVAGLLLARGTARTRELAVRRTLGADRSRVVGQLLAETAVLAALGAGGGLLVATWGIDLARGLVPPLDYAPSLDMAVDGRVFAFTLAMSVLSAAVFGLVPALRVSGTELAGVLRGVEGREGSARVREGLVVGQLALSAVVLVVAGLFVRSFVSAVRSDPGFERAGALVFSVDPETVGFTDEETRAFYDALLLRLRALPGVRSAARASHLPLDGNSSSTPMMPEGASSGSEIYVDYNDVGPGYFETLGLPLVQGRALRPEDADADVERVVVNETLAHRFWPDGGAVGRRMRLGGPGGRPVEVVGVQADAWYRSWNEAPRPFASFDLRREGRARNAVVVRVDGSPAALMPEVGRVVRDLEPTLPVVGLKTLEDHTSATLSVTESGAFLTGAFGVIALLLAAAGLYGLLAFTVARRTREIGVRMALGEERRTVVWGVLAGGLRLAMVGLLLGFVAALLTTRVLGGLLAGVSATDPATFAAVSLLLLAVAAAASWIPARRATRVDPIEALRVE